jgi:hypothetical protein
MFGLTDLGHVIKLEVIDSENQEPKTKIINAAIVLDTVKSTFTLEYIPAKHGDLVTETITKNPKDIYDRVSKARLELEKREVAFMTNLFLLEKDSYDVADLKKVAKPRQRKSKNVGTKEESGVTKTDSTDD